MVRFPASFPGIPEMSDGGIVCPKCRKPVGVKNTIQGSNSVDRYRRCDCGGSISTIEIPKADYLKLRAIVQAAGFDPDNLPDGCDKWVVKQFKTGPEDFRRAFAGSRRRASIAGVENSLTFDQIRELVERDGCLCAMCGSVEFLQLEHIQPISRGGANSLSNVCLLCQDCNYSKGDRMPLEWIYSKIAGA